MNKLWQKWLTNNDHFDKTDANNRRAIVLNFSLSVLSVFLLIYGIFNLLQPDYLMAFFQFGALVATGLLILFFKLTHRVSISAWIGELLFIAVIVIVMIIDHNDYYVFTWALLIPPVSYFILGRLYGTVMSVVFLAGFLVLFSLIPPTLLPDNDDILGFVNIFGTFISLGLIINYYEANRAANLGELRRINHDLKRLSETDKLTGIYNRMRLDMAIEQEITIAANSKKPLSLIMIDIDNFKRINDTYGHLVGDSVLTQAAYLLKKNLPDDLLIGRWGGEEFLIVCPHTDGETAFDIANRLKDLINNFPFDGNIQFTISLGVGTWVDGDEYDDLVKKADSAMYGAKAKGKNLVEL